MYLYPFHRQLRPFTLYGEISLFQKPLKTVVCMAVYILVIFKHSMWVQEALISYEIETNTNIHERAFP